MEHLDERQVVVGIIDTPDSEPALKWAVADATSRRVPLRIITCYQWQLQYRWGGQYDDVHDPELEYLREAAEKFGATTADQARRLAPHLAVDAAAIEGNPVHVLVEESARAAVLVVGSRHLKALRSTVLGSVGVGVAARGHCPVVVVRGPAGDLADNAAVVVGVDGRDAAEAQLGYGFDYASWHRVPLRVVLCWHPDLLASMEWRPEPPPPEKAERWLAEAVAGWRERYPDVEVHAGVVREHPVAGLIAESNGAHLLVVGAHGRHALTGTLLGSVSQGVLHHASCPVAVIPATDHA